MSLSQGRLVEDFNGGAVRVVRPHLRLPLELETDSGKSYNFALNGADLQCFTPGLLLATCVDEAPCASIVLIERKPTLRRFL